MYAIFVIVSLIVISFAIVAPWATITAFKSSGRWAGWTMRGRLRPPTRASPA